MLAAGLPPANDRMLTTCFLAALFHGIVILGVTFSSPGGKSDGDEAPALEVVLVNDQAPSVAQNPNAQYLSERNQQGSGNTLKRERALIPKSSLMPVERSGIPSGDGLAAAAVRHGRGRRGTHRDSHGRRKRSCISRRPRPRRNPPNCPCCSRSGPTWR